MKNDRTESRAGPLGYRSPLLDVSVQRDGASMLSVEVRGELDLATAPVLRNHLAPYSDLPKSNGHPQRVVYHLSDLSFMDATGLEALLGAIDGHSPSTITFREPSRQVRRVLELVGLESMIEDGSPDR